MRCTSSSARVAVGSVLMFVAACGARSGLFLPEPGADVNESAAAGFGASPVASRGGAANAGAAGSGGAAEQAGEAAVPGVGACESQTVSIDDLRPAVTLLVDQSGSMNFRYPDRNSPNTRWQLVGAALFDPNVGLVKTFEHSVRFGIAFFTSDNGFSGGQCPILNEVSAATQNYAALRALYERLRPDDDTPTGAAIRKVVEQLSAPSVRGPQSIVLVTDGDPDTCEEPDPRDEGGPQNGQAEAVAAARSAHAAGIAMYVLGISNDIDGTNLQQLANAGAGRPIDSVFGADPDAAQPFQASANVAGLTAQLSDILNRIPLCEVRLNRDVDATEASLGHVLLDGQALSFGSADGYVLEDSRHIRIVGAACDAAKAGAKQLSVRIACGD